MEIVKNNTYLLQHILNSYNSQELKTRIYLLYLLKYSGLGTNEFYNKLDGDEKRTYLKIKDAPEIDIYGSIVNGTQLDMLWSTFLANGSYLPILKLIHTLDYVRYDGSLDKYKTSKKTDEDRLNAIKNAVYQAAVWSLKSNYNRYKLVKEYCDWAFQFEKLSDIQKSELKKIISP